MLRVPYFVAEFTYDILSTAYVKLALIESNTMFSKGIKVELVVAYCSHLSLVLSINRCEASLHDQMTDVCIRDAVCFLGCMNWIHVRVRN
jgi:hypothetical protein